MTAAMMNTREYELFSIEEPRGHSVDAEFRAEAIRRAELAGRNTRAADGTHWNELGHQLAGATIATYLQEWLQNKTILNREGGIINRGKLGPKLKLPIHSH